MGRHEPGWLVTRTVVLLVAWSALYIALTVTAPGCAPRDDAGTDGRTTNDCAETQQRPEGCEP